MDYAALKPAPPSETEEAAMQTFIEWVNKKSDPNIQIKYGRSIMSIAAFLIAEMPFDEDVKALVGPYLRDFFLTGFGVGYYSRVAEEEVKSE